MRRAWLVLRWVLLALVLLIGGVLLLNSIDDRLDPGAKAMLDAPVEEVPRHQNLYYVALGFGTAGSDPEQAGWEEAQKALGELKAGVDPFELAMEDRDSQLRFSGNQAQLPAPGDFQGALDFARQHPEETARLLADNRLILERSELLYAYTSYADAMPAEAAARVAVLPRWDLITFAKRLRTLQLARDLPRDGPSAIIAWLQRDDRLWRRVIAGDDTGLIGKMILISQLRADFSIASQLIHLEPLDAAQLEALREVGAALSEKQRSLRGVWKTEFRWSAAALPHSFDRNAQSGEEVSWVDALKLRVQKLGYLRNATLNRRYRQTLEFFEIDGHDCVHFAADRAKMLNAPNFVNEPWTLIRNPFGAVLADISAPTYVDYPSRMCDLVGFQRLLSLQILLRERKPADAEIPALIQVAGADYADPYTGAPMQWLAEQKALSFGAYGKREQKLLPWPI